MWIYLMIFYCTDRKKLYKRKEENIVQINSDITNFGYKIILDKFTF